MSQAETQSTDEIDLHEQYEPEKPIHQAVNITSRRLKDRVEPFQHDEFDALWKARDPVTGITSEHWWDDAETAVEFLASRLDIEICHVNECMTHLGPNDETDRLYCDEHQPDDYIECAVGGCDFPTSHSETDHCSTHTWRKGRDADGVKADD